MIAGGAGGKGGGGGFTFVRAAKFADSPNHGAFAEFAKYIPLISSLTAADLEIAYFTSPLFGMSFPAEGAVVARGAQQAALGFPR